MSGSVVCSPDGSHLANYSGGSGTLNDGVVGTTTDADQLFTTRLAGDELPIEPLITLHLGASVFDQFSIAEIVVARSLPDDTAPPTITFTGNAASYPVDAQVGITVSATDAVDGPVTPSCTLQNGTTTAPVPVSCTLSSLAWGLGLGHVSATSPAPRPRLTRPGTRRRTP